MSIESECCLAAILRDDRYCPRCGWECRIKKAEQPVDCADDNFSDEKLRDILRAHLDGVYLMSNRAMCDRLVSILAKRYLAREASCKN